MHRRTCIPETWKIGGTAMSFKCGILSIFPSSSNVAHLVEQSVRIPSISSNYFAMIMMSFILGFRTSNLNHVEKLPPILKWLIPQDYQNALQLLFDGTLESGEHKFGPELGHFYYGAKSGILIQHRVYGLRPDIVQNENGMTSKTVSIFYKNSFNFTLLSY